MTDDFWSKVLNKISEKLSKPSFETWLSGTTAKINDDSINVQAANQFAADWLEARYKGLIVETIKELTGEMYEINFYCIDENSKERSQTFSKQPERNPYEELESLLREHHEIIKKQQEKIEQLENRVYRLEQK